MRNLTLNKILLNIPLWKKELRASKIKINISRIVYLFSFLLFISSCSNPYKNLTKTELSSNEIKSIPYALPYLESTRIYKTDISFFKNDISGLLIIKKTDESVYRIVLTTQFGLNIFDFELDHGNLNVKYCIEYLNKKLILSTFETDFNLLLLQNQFKHLNAFENHIQQQKIWQLKNGKLNYNYIQNTDSEKLENIILRKRNSKKISVGLHSYKGDIPGEISLEHHNIKLKMNLKLIK